MDITLNALQCQNYDIASEREWLIANGLGGYASSTVSGANTRRYHGLLVAALRPPTDRFVLLSKVEERVQIADREFLLSTNQYVNAVFPQGYLHLEKFDLYPVPTFVYNLSHEARITKRVLMPYGENAVYLHYHLEGSRPIQLTLSPLITFKFYHHESSARADFPQAVHFEPHQVRVIYEERYPPMRLLSPGGFAQPSGHWYYRFEHLQELARGLDSQEDLYNPCLFHFYLKPGESATLIATLSEGEPEPWDEAFRQVQQRQSAVLRQSGFRDPMLQLLTLSADTFRVRNHERSTIIAGYHWFTDWTRDTMIALPGLCLATGQRDFAREVLNSYARYMDQGMLPNRFPDQFDTPEYNNVDGTLWYFQAVYDYLRRGWDADFATEILPVLESMVAHHQAGTRHHIRVDEDGLLFAGEPGVQLTWMDAKIGNFVVTPRIGKPVEVNALWVNALSIVAWIEQQMGGSGEAYSRAAHAATLRFQEAFWLQEKGYFADVITDEYKDETLRPNQILALSLPFAPASPEQAKSALQHIQTHLLTPFGLRTLSPDHPDYRGRYHGPVEMRDTAYHQGTAWAWLMGPFITAYVKITGDRMGARRLLRPLREHLREAGLGSVSEIFDGDLPNLPNGCIAQAWSVGELIRAMADDLEIQ